MIYANVYVAGEGTQVYVMHEGIPLQAQPGKSHGDQNTALSAW